MTLQTLPASFRDPSGFLFRGADGELYRQVNRCYQADFELLNSSGLYRDLTRERRLIEHDVADDIRPISAEGVRVVKPRPLSFISYPYEWAFSALQDAALLTLDVQLRALAHGMQLKDASAYNVQFEGCRPVFIDTLSFEKFEENRPWKAYGQFCRHFLAPLALMSKTHADAGYLLRDFIDGIPLDVCSRMLPARTRFSVGMQLHIHLHARMIAKHRATGASAPNAEENNSIGETRPKRRQLSMPKNRLTAFLESLRCTVASLRPAFGKTEWGDYYEDNSYSDAAFQEKQRHVAWMLDVAAPQTVWDLGANNGTFSGLAAGRGCLTHAFDIDPACVEQAYTKGKKEKQARLLPLRMDLTNPSPALGWAHKERSSLAQRGPADVTMALALIHHLAISNNVPFRVIADFFRSLGKRLIVEFVPKSDPQVRRLLQSRDDVFPSYHEHAFEQSFGEVFEICETVPVGDSGRTLYLMRAH